MRILGHIHDIARDLLDLAYPGRCVACGVAVDLGNRFCGDCDYQLVLMEQRPQCMECGAPVAFDDAACQRCDGRGYRLFDRMVRLSIFESPVRELVTRFKYYHGWPIGELLADRAMRLKRVQHLMEETDLLVPVPLHPLRQMVRGFNQAQVFASTVGKLAGKRVACPAIRVRNTKHQTFHHKSERRRNVRDAFALISPRLVTGKRVTLVDDVFTTASTLKELASTLKPAGPMSINVLTIAMADPKNYRFESV